MDLTETGCEEEKWTGIAKDMVQQWVSGNVVIKVQVL